MRYWDITEADVDRLEIGVGILGTGGGGSARTGAIIVRNELRAGRRIRLVRPADLPAGTLVLPICGMGAPTVGDEMLDEGNEGIRLVEIMEKVLGQKIGAVMSDEVGGSNGLAPMITAARLGLPMVDADGMGRAFPEVQMTSLFIYGQPTVPTALVDSFGNAQVMTAVTSPEMLERFMRATTVVMGCRAQMSTPPMTGAFVEEYGIVGTLSLAWRLGDAVLSARAAKTDPVQAILSQSHGKLLAHGKIIDLDRRIEGGFNRGSMTLAGLDADAGRSLIIDIQNEFLVARDGDEVLASVPDLIVVVDTETGRAIATEELRFGLRVSVLAMSCSPLLRTQKALASVGPRAFGYDLDFHPVGETADNPPAPGYVTGPATKSIRETTE